ncbi:MAG: NAD(P)H-dependent oxidoreductase subunit E [Clostridium sp.]|nr:NAD(P)H-dependent oxidoreductase subunit E [Clostridium sp.]
MALRETSSIPFRDTPEQAAELKAWLEENKGMPGAALPALQKAQEIYGYLPVEVQTVIADALEKPLAEIYGISTFYSMFTLVPQGRHKVGVCMGTACYVKGSGRILELLQQKLGVKDGLTSDGRFNLESCRCLGCCGMAPVMMVDGDVYGNLTGDELDAILSKYE